MDVRKRTRSRIFWGGLACGATLALAPGPAAAQGQQQQQPATAPKPAGAPIIYPAKNQSADQQAKDKTECNTWATQQTGYDPVAAAQNQQAQAGQQQQGKQGGAVGGAAKGAAAGAAIGAIAGDAGKGAAVGAASGGAVGGARKKKKEAAQQEAATQQQQANAQQLAQFQKAFGTCMQGRGYTVSQ